MGVKKENTEERTKNKKGGKNMNEEKIGKEQERKKGE